ncbi:hypothetical protein [Amycolatopsis sp. H20-H5]|uniref:hypothetical protein n=1 Tax=Amycolatopsis sp. H20-H5 TaxID=3046309 RepID=UPI002DB96B4D|nr:hypothetical protein [Amycolatopsis sp. H20-H5]MEC3981941.1 hypothetical protein [Amycolatopsis sp. H20-H5]
MSQTPGAAPPLTARELRSPVALALADLAAIFDDLQFVLRCCERLLAELARGPARDTLTVEALWVAALNSYARCFRPGERGMGLKVTDLAATELKGEVVQWHALLGKLRTHFVDGSVNPREAFTVGVAQSEAGKAEGIMLTSAVLPQVDEETVRQTGRLAFELSKLVDERIQTQQKTVFTVAGDLSVETLNELTRIDVGVPPGVPAQGE